MHVVLKSWRACVSEVYRCLKLEQCLMEKDIITFFKPWLRSVVELLLVAVVWFWGPGGRKEHMRWKEGTFPSSFLVHGGSEQNVEMAALAVVTFPFCAPPLYPEVSTVPLEWPSGDFTARSDFVPKACGAPSLPYAKPKPIHYPSDAIR